MFSDNLEIKDVIIEVTDVVKKKKGRPRKNPIEPISENEVQPEKKKRGRKKKEKVIEEIKPKKKRGRKAAIKFFSSSIRKKIPLTTIIYDNDNSVLHLDIKETSDMNKMTYDALKTEYENRYSTSISNTRFDSDISDNESINIDIMNDNVEVDNNDVLGEYIEQHISNVDINTEKKLCELYEKRIETRLVQDKQLYETLENIQNDDKLLLKLISKNKVNDSPRVIKSCKDKNNDFLTILSEFIETENWLYSTR